MFLFFIIAHLRKEKSRRKESNESSRDVLSEIIVNETLEPRILQNLNSAQNVETSSKRKRSLSQTLLEEPNSTKQKVVQDEEPLVIKQEDELLLDQTMDQTEYTLEVSGVAYENGKDYFF